MAKKKISVSIPGKFEGKMRTIDEAADYLRMGRSTLYETYYDGLITGYPQKKGPMLFNVDDLDAWLETCKNPANIVGQVNE